jgi:hypothetical protein
MQQKKAEPSFSHGKTNDSLWKEIGLNNNQRTPESEINNGSFTDHDEAERIVEYAWQQAERKDCMDAFRMVGQGVNIKEDTEWFMDLNFDDLQVPNYSAFGPTFGFF